MQPLLEPITMDFLPNELHVHLSNYLSDEDLQTIRSVSQRWNETAKYTLFNRGVNSKFTLDTVARLAQFNATFVNYEPKEDFASAEFYFGLPVLASEAAGEHLDTFKEVFGTVLKILVLSFGGRLGVQALTPNVNAVVDRNVAGLFSKVKGHLETLWLRDYRSLCPSVLGPGPFPALKDLNIYLEEADLAEAIDDADQEEGIEDADLAEAIDDADQEEGIEDADQEEAIEDDQDEAIEDTELAEAIESADQVEVIETGLDSTSATGEAFILALSEKVPAIEEFFFHVYTLTDGGDASFLPTVLRNLTRANPAVPIKLGLRQRDTTVDLAYLADLVTFRITNLLLLVDTRDNIDKLRMILKWLSALSDCLKWFTFHDAGELSHHGADRTDLHFPPMRVLEALSYCSYAPNSLIRYDSPAHFPSLRYIDAVFNRNVFTVPLPTVTALDLEMDPDPPFEERTPQQIYADAEALFANSFPNLRRLACCDAFCGVPSFYNLRHLTYLRLKPYSSAISSHFFWDCVTRAAPKLTLDEIMALPEPNAEDDHDNGGANFRGLEKLEELVLKMGESQEVAYSQLDTLLFLSKTKRLQRLPELVLDLDETENSEVFENYLRELQKYHDCVRMDHYYY